jgi:hypothetical protein
MNAKTKPSELHCRLQSPRLRGLLTAGLRGLTSSNHAHIATAYRCCRYDQMAYQWTRNW